MSRSRRCGARALALALLALGGGALGQVAERLALAERAERALAAAGESPGREYANRLRSERYPAWLAWLRGEGEAPAEPAAVLADLTRVIELTERGPTWPPPPTATIPRAAGPLVCDGRLDEPAWAAALCFRQCFPFNATEPTGPTTLWRLLWDDERLYVGYDCADVDLIAPLRERDDTVFFDDCVELFILPEGPAMVYWEVVVAPSGSLFDALQTKLPDRWGCLGDAGRNLPGLQVGVHVDGTLNQLGDVDRGYAVELAVPLAELARLAGRPMGRGNRLRAMLVRLDRTGETFAAYAFTPLLGWGHNLWNHATLMLGEG